MLEEREELHAALLRICERSGEHSADDDTGATAVASWRRTKIDAGYLLWLLGFTEDSDDGSEIDSDKSSHVLISYAPNDEEQLELARKLYRLLREAGYEAWVDAESAQSESAKTADVQLSRTRSSSASVNHIAGERMKILDDMELRKSVFISHSRRDPAAVNIVYTMIYALRYAVTDDGLPLCTVTYLPAEQEEMWLWVDKEQMADAGGDDWVQILTKAQKRATANWFFLGNAYCGSAECMKEFLYADQKRFNLVPVFIERFAEDEEEFDGKKDRWKPDHDLDNFDKWEAKKDMIDRLACSRQGVMAGLDTEDFVCDLCRDSRDAACLDCTDWERALATPSGPKLQESVETLARYLVKENQLAGRGDTVTEMTAGVAKASAVVVLCSRAYKLSPSSRTEAQHAVALNKPIVCVNCEDWEGDGWLKQFMADKPTADCYGDSMLEEAFELLVEQLGPPPEAKLRQSKSSFSGRTRSSTNGSSALSSTVSTAILAGRKRGSSRYMIDGDDDDDDNGDDSANQSRRRKALVATQSAIRFQSPSQTTSQTSQEDTHSSSSSTSGPSGDKDHAKQQKKEGDPSSTRDLRRPKDKGTRSTVQLPERISRSRSEGDNLAPAPAPAAAPAPARAPARARYPKLLPVDRLARTRGGARRQSVE